MGMMTPAEADTVFIIELKSGTRFITDNYWQEGSQIRFDLYGGTAGVKKELIKSITPAERPPGDETTDVKQAQAESHTEKKEETLKDESAPLLEAVSKISEADKSRILYRKELILDQMKKAKADFKAAQARNDRSEMKNHRDHILKSYDDMQTLYDEVKEANGGTAPEWWPRLWP